MFVSCIQTVLYIYLVKFDYCLDSFFVLFLKALLILAEGTIKGCSIDKLVVGM